MAIEYIFLPTRPQPDTIVGIFLLQQFGEERYPGIAQARVQVQHQVESGETFETLLEKGILAIDVGSGPYDHHGTEYCASELIARHLQIHDNPALQQLLQYARRDDRVGKGTASTDALDRAFGLSGLIASLNKLYVQEPQAVVDSALPLIKAHYHAAHEHHNALPAEVARKKREGTYEERHIRQGKKNLKASYVISDKPTMPTFLRSFRGPRADVVVQKLEDSNHMSILTKQDRKVDLSKAMALIRLREAALEGKEIADDETYLSQTGRVDEVPYWYYDPATNSLLNGGPHNKTVQESNIPWDELKRIVTAGIELGGAQVAKKSSYYLSINIPRPMAETITKNIVASPDVKVHKPENIHITLEYFGEKTPEEAKELSKNIQQALHAEDPFSLTVRSTDLTVGAPEGYAHAWFLTLDEEARLAASHMRTVALRALGMVGEKMLHITIATKRDAKSNVADSAVRFSEPFEISIPISEIVLMQNTEENGRRVYKPHSTFALTF